MTILLCGLSAETAQSAARALAENGDGFVAAPNARDAAVMLGDECPSVILVGGAGGQSLVESCVQLRAIDGWANAVIVAAVERPEDVAVALEAGADDFFFEALGDTVLRSRLRVAKSAAQKAVERREDERERDEFFRLSLELLCIAGLDGYFKTINPAWSRLLGWSTAELLAAPWLEFVHPDDRERTIAAGSQLGAGRDVIGFTNRYACKDRSYRWLDWQCAASVDRGAIYAVARDVTEARAARESLRELNENLATTLHSIGDAVISTDRSGAIQRMNPVAEALTGWTLGEAVGRSLDVVLPLVNADTRARVDSPVNRAMRDAVVVALASETRLVRRDGTELPIADSCAPIRSEQGIVNGAVLVFRDLSAEHEAARSKVKLQQQLVFSDRMASVGTLAAGVAHEINNPLSYVGANVETAIEEIRTMSGGSSSGRMRELEEMLVDARDGVARIGKIVRGLKTFSRSDEERRSVVDLVGVLELSINMAFNEIRHRARLVKDYGKLPLVDGDDARLGQVFINLLVNAAHAFADGDTSGNEIRIVTSTDPAGRAIVEIRDTGAGIHPDLLARVFDPFFTTKPVGIGTGLGLAISHNIVTGMGGEIAIESELGRGTTFRVALPPSKSGQPLAALSTAHPKAALAQVAKVLVVDDEPAVGMAVRRVLRQHEVTVVNAAQEALDVLATGKEFDVVLSDLMMPGMSGMELYRTLVRLHPKIASRVVFVTGGAFTSEANSFLDQVSNERMDKPFDSAKLRALVQKFVK